MRYQILFLALSACSTIPDEVRHPEPEAILLRVWEVTPCVSNPCDSAPVRQVHRGPLIFADADSLVLNDRIANDRAVVRDQRGRQIEIYRGQKVTGEAVARSAGRGALVGLLTGAATALTGVAAAELLGVDGFAGETIKAGLIVGTTAGVGGGTLDGLREGDAIWHRVTVTQVRQELCRCAHP